MMSLITIICSNCGIQRTFPYSAWNVVSCVRDGWNSYSSCLYCPICSETWSERNGSKQLNGADATIILIDHLYSWQRGKKEKLKNNGK